MTTTQAELRKLQKEVGDYLAKPTEELSDSELDGMLQKAHARKVEVLLRDVARDLESDTIPSQEKKRLRSHQRILQRHVASGAKRPPHPAGLQKELAGQTPDRKLQLYREANTLEALVQRIKSAAKS